MNIILRTSVFNLRLASDPLLYHFNLPKSVAIKRGYGHKGRLAARSKRIQRAKFI